MLERMNVNSKLKNMHFGTFANRELNSDILNKEALKNFAALTYEPDQLTAEIVKTIGAGYLSKHPIKRDCFSQFFSSPIEQEVAKALKNCNEESPQACWKYLLNEYNKLPKANSSLALTMLRTFELSFSYQFNAHYNDMSDFLRHGNMRPVQEIGEQIHLALQNFYVDKKILQSPVLF